MSAADVDQNGSINYTEFLAATLNRELYEANERLQSVFDDLD